MPLQILREFTLFRTARMLFMPILMVIGIPAAVLCLLYLLIGVDPRPFVGLFVGDALDSSLTIIGSCLLVWLAYAVIYSFLVRCGPTDYVAALRDHPTPDTRVRWRPPVDGWRIFSCFGLRLHRALISMYGSTLGPCTVWSAATHPQLE